MSTGIVFDPRYLDHHMGMGHPENPKRLEAIARALAREEGLSLIPIPARQASAADIELIHAHEYVGLVAGTSGRDFVVLDPDTSATAKTYQTACLAAGGVLAAADAVMQGEVRNAFAFVRPPGHHAEVNRAMGFCIFNNIAIAAEHLLRRRGLERILIVDWDVHHGNGTQNAFSSRRDVLFFSTHQSPFYPGSGRPGECGYGPGEGFTVNVPLRPGRGDADFLHIYRQILRPIAASFRPDFILVSAGFDIARGDLLGGMFVSPEGFAALTAELAAMAESLCRGRLLFVLEGGYNEDALASGAISVLGQLCGRDLAPAFIGKPSDETLEDLSPVIDMQKKYWPI